MKKGALFLFSLVLAVSFSVTAFAQTNTSAIDTSDRTTDHNALRTMLVDATKALNERNFPNIEKYLDPNVNVIYQNAVVADGVAEVQAFQKKMYDGDSAVLAGYTADIQADKLTEFYGNTAIAYGTINNHFTFTGGLKMDLPSKWTATLVKKDGNWKVVSLTLTSNIFDNPLLTSAQASAKYFGFGGLALGLILGFLLFKFFRKNKV